MNQDDAPTMIVPPGTRLGWSDTGYALLNLMREYVWVNSVPTEEPGNGGVAFLANLLKVVTVERRGEEWGMALIFWGGGRVTIPQAGFRGSLVSDDGDLTIVTDHDTFTIRAV